MRFSWYNIILIAHAIAMGHVKGFRCWLRGIFVELKKWAMGVLRKAGIINDDA